ncbi:activator-dependent family glycosyltransferase [Actinomadura sp. KC345]|uniref:activator-dependent family glycosyltransferase n=1 Tax=Actinomadura sp. KC345 TaxID=2530371 RepID=UPI001045B1D7|nr:activator-dependent family glycosyltransferase [Actinomadura sp. KC345]TDC45410.1 activator-dependent family glycosyltransferase [Actinomadura sp. KC345]
MRVLFTTLAVKAHLYNLVPLAWALRAAGHEVRVAAQADLADDITRAGLTAVPIGEPAEPDWLTPEQLAELREQEERAHAEDPFPWHQWRQVLDLGELRPAWLTYDYMHGVFSAWTSSVFREIFTPDMVDELVEFARGWRPDLVIWDPVVFAAPVAARVCGAAHARFQYSLDLVGGIRQRYLRSLARRPPELREDPLEEWLSPILGRYGFAFDEDVVAGQWTIDPVPPVMRLATGHHVVSVRHVPYNGMAAVPDWLREPPERPRVCLTLGFSFREILGGDQTSAGELLEAMADLDVEVVATLNADQLAGVAALPDNVRTVDFVPMNELLPTCAAVVHHGGFGTWQTALAHGVPQVVLPSDLWDSMPRARLLHEAGAGLHAPETGRSSAEEVREMLARVLKEPRFARNAARLRAESLSTPVPREVVPSLERLTAAHRS